MALAAPSGSDIAVLAIKRLGRNPPDRDAGPAANLVLMTACFAIGVNVAYSPLGERTQRSDCWVTI